MTPPTTRESSEVEKPILIGSIFNPGLSRGRYPVRATRDSLPRIRYLLASLTGNKDGSMEHMAWSLARTNSVPDQHSIYPGGQHTLAFYTKCVMP